MGDVFQLRVDYLLIRSTLVIITQINMDRHIFIMANKHDVSPSKIIIRMDIKL